MSGEEERTLENLRRMVRERDQFPLAAYLFLYEALEYAQRETGGPRHVSGSELAKGWRARAIEVFGPLAGMVMRSWKVTRTGHIGDMVFHLVEGGLMRKTEDDQREDFEDVFDFEDAFDLDLLAGQIDASKLAPSPRPVTRELPGAERSKVGQS